MDSVPGILLGAGGSERFGSEKLMAHLPTGERLIERALMIHLQSYIAPLVLVVSMNLHKVFSKVIDVIQS